MGREKGTYGRMLRGRRPAEKANDDFKRGKTLSSIEGDKPKRPLTLPHMILDLTVKAEPDVGPLTEKGFSIDLSPPLPNRGVKRERTPSGHQGIVKYCPREKKEAEWRGLSPVSRIPYSPKDPQGSQ
jgi:hypothetical protein